VCPLAWSVHLATTDLHSGPPLSRRCPHCCIPVYLALCPVISSHVRALITLQLAKKRLPPPGHPLSAPSTSPQPSGAVAAVSPSGEAFISPEDYVAQDEIYKASGTSNTYRCHPSLQCHCLHGAVLWYTKR
jgi:hypothetical protein